MEVKVELVGIMVEIVLFGVEFLGKFFVEFGDFVLEIYRYWV